MTRVLLVDDSPHAQRMGERILTEEGYEVVTVSNADSALVRLEDVDPDVVIADTVMPGRSGYEVCGYIRMNPRHRHVRVILTVGILEPFDEAQVKRAEADGVLKKPFEASALLKAVKPLAEAAVAARAAKDSGEAKPSGAAVARPVAAPFVAVVDAEQVRAAVTIALDAAMESMIDEITARVMDSLRSKPAGEVEQKAGAEQQAPAAPQPVKASNPAPAPEQPKPAAEPKPAKPEEEVVRRVSPIRPRAGSILGLNLDPADNPRRPGSK